MSPRLVELELHCRSLDMSVQDVDAFITRGRGQNERNIEGADPPTKLKRLTGPTKIISALEVDADVEYVMCDTYDV